MTFDPNKYQIDVFDFIREQVSRMTEAPLTHINSMGLAENKPLKFAGIYHAVVEAVAGSGKTRTIVEALQVIPRHLEVAFVAFNKHIAEELKKRAPSNVRVMTTHSMGLMAITKAFNFRPQVDDKKVYQIIKSMFLTDYMQVSEEQVQYFSPIIKQLVALMKATLMPVEEKSIRELMAHYSVDFNNEEDIPLLFDMVSKILGRCKADVKTIDFDDMIWMPVIYNMPMPKYDFIFIDEAQDLNKAQTEMILKAIKPTGTIVAVGDRHQSLYGFRGADTESIPNLISRLKAAVLPLSITYRCPKKVVEMAKKFVPEIEAAPHAKEGIFAEVGVSDMIERIKPGDMVVCRYNAPLVRPAYMLLSKGIKVTIRGRDIGEGLLALIRKLDPSNMEDFYAKLGKWLNKEMERCRRTEASPESVQDKYDVLQTLAEDCDEVIQITRKINSIFSDNGSEIVFSSIHRAKGLEADNIWILFPNLMPSKYAKRHDSSPNPMWEFDQEENCQYVATTRPKEALYHVE